MCLCPVPERKLKDKTACASKLEVYKARARLARTEDVDEPLLHSMAESWRHWRVPEKRPRNFGLIYTNI